MESHSADSNTDPRNASLTAIPEYANALPPAGPEDPRTPFPGQLQLTRAQEDALCQLAWDHYTTMDQELCRSETDATGRGVGQEWFAASPADESGDRTQETNRLRDSFFGKRLLYELTYQNKRDWRVSLHGGLFRTSNMTLATSRRITTQRIARFTRYFFETRPWFVARPQGKRDKPFADKLAKYADWKLHDSGSASDFRRAIRAACVIGEGILKTVRHTDDEYYFEEMTVAVDESGNPIVADDGDYITEDDVWIAEPGPMEAAAGAGALLVAPAAQPQPEEVLERDGVTRRNGYKITTSAGQFNFTGFETKLLERRTVHYSGAKTSLIYYRDFMCPLGAADIHSAPCIVHLYDIDVSELASQYAANKSPETIRQAVEAINAATSGDSMDGTGADVAKPRLSIGETTDHLPGQSVAAKLSVGEFYLRADPQETGITRDIMLVMDLRTRIPLYYNYTAAISPTRRRPFQVIRENEVDGRWFGQGTMEKFETADLLIDMFLNRAVITQSRAGRVDFFRASDTIQGDASPDLTVNYGDTYTVKSGVDPREVLHSVYLQDNKSNELKATLELLNQAATNESGTASANDSAMAGLDTSQLATGINNIAAAGNELTMLPIMELKEGMTRALNDFVATTYRFHDETEVMYFYEGETPEELRIEKREVQTLTINVEILLTTLLIERQLAGKRAALMDAQGFYQLAAVNPAAAAALAPGYRDLLAGAGFDNADAMIAIPEMPGMLPNGSEMEPTTPPMP